MKKRIITALLLAAMTVSAAACAGESAAENKETQAENNAETTAAVTEEERITPDLPEKNFEGYEFRVLTKGQFSSHWSSKDIAAEEENGEPINDAVYLRNRNVGEKYNVKIADVSVQDYYNRVQEAVNAVLAGDNAYDMFSMFVGSLSEGGYLYNINDIEYMDLTKPYYDQGIIESLSIGGKLFSVVGDLQIMDNEATVIVTFNKEMADEYGINDKYGTDLYGLVQEGRFTFDVFHETASMAEVDLNGDGEMTDLDDQWGFMTEKENYILMFFGAGGRTVALDADGKPEPILGSDRDISIVQKLAEIQNATYTINGQKLEGKYTDVYSEVLDKNFSEGRALYSVAGLNRVSLFRNSETDFGILPIPKFDEAQENHYSPVSSSSSNFIAFPSTMVEVERNGIIVEALSCESMYTLTPAYYDITLSGKAIRDEQSLEMLDIIFGSRAWDMAYFFRWVPLIYSLYEPDTFTSTLASQENEINIIVEDAYNAIMALK